MLLIGEVKFVNNKRPRTDPCCSPAAQNRKMWAQTDQFRCPCTCWL